MNNKLDSILYCQTQKARDTLFQQAWATGPLELISRMADRRKIMTMMRTLFGL